MAFQNFVDFRRPTIDAAWLNHVDRATIKTYTLSLETDGVTDMSGAIQTTVDAIGQAGGGILVFPPGTYKINTGIAINYSNVTLSGYGAVIDASDMAYGTSSLFQSAVFRFASPETIVSTTLASTAAKLSRVLSLTSATNFRVGDVVRAISTETHYHNRTAIAYYNNQNRIVEISGNNVTLECPIEYPLTVGAYTVTVSAIQPISNCVVQGFRFVGAGVVGSIPNGYGPGGVFGVGVAGLAIRDCRFEGFQAIACGTDRAVDFTVDGCYFEGIPHGVAIVEDPVTGVGTSGFYGCYAVRTRRAMFTNCISNRLRHMFDAAEAADVIQSNSIAYNTHRAAFGSHEETYNLTITGNNSYACYAAVIVRAFTTLIEGNTFDGYAGVITTGRMKADEASGQLTISNNRMTYSVNTGSGIAAYGGEIGAVNIVGVYDFLHINNNTIIVDPYQRPDYDPVTDIYPAINLSTAKISNMIIADNSFDAPSGIYAIVPDYYDMEYFRGLLISGNIFKKYTTNAIRLIGNLLASAPADYIKIVDNLGVPDSQAAGNMIVFATGTGYFGENIVIRGNTQWGDNSAVVGYSGSDYTKFMALPVVELNDEFVKTNQGGRALFYGTAGTLPSDATAMRAGVILRTNPSSGNPDYWSITLGGTEGSISGVTGSITSGTTAITFAGNTSAKAYAGSYITIAGAGVASANLNVRILSVSDDHTTGVIATAASTTVVAAAVTRYNPQITAGPSLA